MSKKSLITRLNKIKNKFNKSKKIRKLLKKNRNLDKLLLNILPKSSSRIKIRNRCFLTGRSRGVYRKFMLSRCILREKILCGEIPGFFKISW
ncbi:30S ribosomal protein S14 [Candidatus Vidania fulgoroideorum]